jgi:DNA-binding SARP family transcriptional activator
MFAVRAVGALMARLVLTLLGGFEARLDGGPLLTLPTRKAQALVAYLSLPPGRAHPRDKLAALLWGDQDDTAARNSLRQTLFALRRALAPANPPCLVVEGDTLALNPAVVEVDVAAFEREVADGAPAALERAAALYHGDLLAGLTVAEVPFEEWLMAERERLRELALEALAKLLAHQRDTGATGAAIQTAGRLLALDPLQEPVHRVLMRVYAGLGRRAEAIRQYQVCARVLRHELNVDPEAETAALYRELVDGSPRWVPDSEPEPSPGRPDGAVSPDRILIGRRDQMVRLMRAFETASLGHGQVAVVLGEAGIGKTRLVQELLGTARRRGARGLIGHCYETEQILPFGPWVDALRAWRRGPDAEDPGRLVPAWRPELTRLLPELRRRGEGPPGTLQDPLRLFEAIASLVLTLATPRPLLLVLEDMHWADEMSLRLLAFVGRRIDAARVLLLSTVREEELARPPLLRQVLDELRRGPRLLELELGPLSRQDTGVLVRTLAPEHGALPALEEHVWAVSEGNPFAALETLGALQETGSIQQPGFPGVPRRVRDLILGRMERLGEGARSLAAIAAVVGREFDQTLLARAARLEERQVSESVEELLRRRLLTTRADRLDFVHDRIRRAVLDDMAPPRRKLLHREVARAIQELHAADLEPHWAALGTHYRAAEVWDRAVTYLQMAGRAALGHGAHREALALFRQALAAHEHLPANPERLAESFELRFLVRHALFPLPERPLILEELREAERLAQALGDEARLARTLALIANELWMRGEHQAALTAAEQGRARAAALTYAELAAVTDFRLGQIRHTLGNYPAAVEALRRCMSFLDNRRLQVFYITPEYPMAAGWLAWTLAELGRFDEAIVRGTEAVEIVETVQNAYGLAHACFHLGLAHVLRGDLEPALAVLARGVEVCRAREFPVLSVINSAELGYAQALAGRPGESVPRLERAVEQARSMKLEFPRALYLAWLSEAYLLADRVGDAERAAEQALDLARSRGERGHEAYAHQAWAAALATDPERVEAAEEHYGAVQALATELGMFPLGAHCHLGLGRLHSRVGRTDRARSELAAAIEEFRAMKMTYWLPGAKAELALLG